MPKEYAKGSAIFSFLTTPMALGRAEETSDTLRLTTMSDILEHIVTDILAFLSAERMPSSD